MQRALCDLSTVTPPRSFYRLNAGDYTWLVQGMSPKGAEAQLFTPHVRTEPKQIALITTALLVKDQVEYCDSPGSFCRLNAGNYTWLVQGMSPKGAEAQLFTPCVRTEPNTNGIDYYSALNNVITSPK